MVRRRLEMKKFVLIVAALSFMCSPVMAKGKPDKVDDFIPYGDEVCWPVPVLGFKVCWIS